jgi:elongation factor 1-gamma
VCLVVAKENKLDIELVHTQPPNVDAEYLKLNPLGCVPTFVGSNGFILSEVMAIAIYCEHGPPAIPNLQDEPNYKISVIPV